MSKPKKNSHCSVCKKPVTTDQFSNFCSMDCQNKSSQDAQPSKHLTKSVENNFYYRDCPQCAERIKRKAKICKECSFEPHDWKTQLKDIELWETKAKEANSKNGINNPTDPLYIHPWEYDKLEEHTKAQKNNANKEEMHQLVQKVKTLEKTMADTKLGMLIFCLLPGIVSLIVAILTHGYISIGIFIVLVIFTILIIIGSAADKKELKETQDRLEELRDKYSVRPKDSK